MQLLLCSRERRWNLSSNQRLQIIHHLEISLDYPRKFKFALLFSVNFFRLTASITLNFLYLFVMTSISVGIATELHTQLIALIEIDNTEQIIMSQFVGFFCFVFVSFFSSDIRRKRRILIFTFFSCHKTRQLIVELFKKYVYNFTRAHDNRLSRHQLKYCGSLTRSAMEKHKNRERKTVSQHLFTLTHPQAAADPMKFSAVFFCL